MEKFLDSVRTNFGDMYSGKLWDEDYRSTFELASADVQTLVDCGVKTVHALAITDKAKAAIGKFLCSFFS